MVKPLFPGNRCAPPRRSFKIPGALWKFCREHHATRLQSPPAQSHRGVDLISDVLPFGRLWYGEPGAVIGVYNAAGNVIETHEHAGDFKETLDYPFTSIRV